MKGKIKISAGQMTAIVIAFVNIFTGFATPLTNSYTSYSWTDLNGLDPTLYSSCMSIMGVILVGIMCISGILVQKTRSRWGQTRPWLMFLPPLLMAGGILTFTGFGETVVEKVIVLCVAYILAYGANDLITAARTTLYGLMAGDDYKASTMYVSYHWLGTNVGMLIGGGITLSLVNFFGNGSQHRGFVITELIMTVLVLFGYAVLVYIGKNYDLPNTTSDIQIAKNDVSIMEMFKSILTNKCILCCISSDIFRFTGYYALMGISVYQCMYVLENINAMSLVLTISGISSVFGNYLAPYIVERVGGRKKNVQIFGGLTGLFCFLIGFFGKSEIGFIVCLSLSFFFMSFIDSVDYAMYMDAGEYQMYKTGKDIKAFFVSMYGIAVKIGITLSAIMIGIMLKIISYQPGMELDMSGKTKLNWCTALTMTIGYCIPLLIMKLHPVSDAQIEKIAKVNRKENMKGEEESI